MDLLAAGGKRDIKPFVLQLGVALALSFAGFYVTNLRSGRCSKPSSAAESEGSGKGLKDELRILKTEEALAKIINGTSTTTTTTTTTTTFVGLSPTSKSSGDKDGFLLPEFNELILKEFGSDATPANQTPKKPETREGASMEQEIMQLKNLVMSLRERERSLELQLLEYYGLQEQEAAIRELEGQVRINTMEAKLFSLKIESLQAEKQRLQAHLSDYSKTVTELEAAKGKVKSLKRKLKAEGEESREKMGSLQRKISVFQNRMEVDGRERADIERRLKRIEELEDEVLKLRILNSELAHENLELNKSLESSLVKLPEVGDLEEAKQLREENEVLKKEIEQLQTDRCTDVEELVYLRWINACLRYELRNYQPQAGKTVARDLSKTLSPKSEEKAKHLIIEYAHSNTDEKHLSLVDFDVDYYSSSQASAGESDDTSYDNSYSAAKTRTNKSKFFTKLKKLVLGKQSRGNRTPISCADSDRRVSFSTYSVDDMIGQDSCRSLSPSEIGMEEKCVESHGRPSLDIQKLRKLNLEEDRKHEQYKGNIGRSYSFQRMSSLDESCTVASQASSGYSEDIDSPEKIELKKFADVLKKSRLVQKNKR